MANCIDTVARRSLVVALLQYRCSFLLPRKPSGSTTQARKNVVQAIKETAEHLDNTPTICRKCCVHPEILDAYLSSFVPPQSVNLSDTCQSCTL
jgi:hypothetical protein